MQSADELIQSSDLPSSLSKDRLISALVPRVGFTSYPWMPRGLPLGASRFGGPADLPLGLEWPSVNGRPLLLLAQLNFGDLRIKRFHPVAKRLPDRGWLCLFLDVENCARGVAGEVPGVVAMQFEGTADELIRREPEPSPDAMVWSHCHAVTVFPADHHLCLPELDAVDSPIPVAEREENRDAYYELLHRIEELARTRHEVTLLGSPSLLNPDPRGAIQQPNDWMLLLEFRGECSWAAGVRNRDSAYLDRPTFGDVDFVQYFVRKSDYEAGRLNLGHMDYMLT